MLSSELKSDMKASLDRLQSLDFLDRTMIISKIDALYERQMVEEEKQRGDTHPGHKTG